MYVCNSTCKPEPPRKIFAFRGVSMYVHVCPCMHAGLQSRFLLHASLNGKAPLINNRDNYLSLGRMT